MGGNLPVQSTVSQRVPSLRQIYGVGSCRVSFSFFNSLRDGYLPPLPAVSFSKRVNRITISVGC